MAYGSDGFNRWLTPKDVTNVTSRFLYCDFVNYMTNMTPWGGVIRNSGTCESEWTYPERPGVLSYRTSTSTDCGYGFRTGSASLLLGGGEKTNILFRTAYDQAPIKRRMGWFSGYTDLSVAPACGVYCEIINGTIYARTSISSTVVSSASTCALSAATWYRLQIEISPGATGAIYTLFPYNSGTAMWTTTLEGGIPTAYEQALGHGDICISSNAAVTSGVNIGSIDYMDIWIPNARRVS